jgi:hypothetical protein
MGRHLGRLSAFGFRLSAGSLIVVTLLLMGCNAPATMHVWGDVSLDGKPVEASNIELLPIEGTSGPNVGGVIKDGAYDIPAERGPLADGTYRVELRAYRETGRAPTTPRFPGKELPEREAVFPPEYNTRSTLRVKISPKASENRFDFNVVKAK